ncbi:MAG: MoaD/ThiS family protein [Planctomycetaceae bacterium]|nr:MoaD/ThiS family protein [Planctomycetaceae bacterium]
MPIAFIPSALRRLTGGASRVEVAGHTVREVVAALEARFPGVQQRLCENDRLKPGMSVVVGTSIAGAGLMAHVPKDAEVHFVQAVGGG